MIGRLALFLLVAGGCVLSYLTYDSNAFFSYKTEAPDLLPAPFTNVTESDVGLFRYCNVNGTGCHTYDHLFIAAIKAQRKDNIDEFSTNVFAIIAQFCAVCGPAFAALGGIMSTVECLFLGSTTCTLGLIGFCLNMGGIVQSLTFIIYGQSEFCFGSGVANDCQLGGGAIYSICAAGCFYFSALLWCCLPRVVRPSSSKRRAEESGGEDYYIGQGAHVATDEEAQQNNAFESDTIMGGSPSSPNMWASSDQGDIQATATGSSNWQDEAEQPAAPSPAPAGWQDHTTEWTAHDTTNPTGSTYNDPYANPFLSEEDRAGGHYPPQRPAYGNLQ
eukprot:Nitzschia sp. Nitz4//scaffold342_size18221//3533//4729//NITZ4_008793-RA/size18221-snap-gene-0.24-mRNA-1//-1//CDS//3329548571//4180//frame0